MTEKIIQIGAEAKIILVELKGKQSFIIKDRIKKGYRLPELDLKIRSRRTRAEGKLLEKASKIINSPKPFFQNSIKESTKLKMSFIKGKRLSESLDNYSLNKQKEICRTIGFNIAKLHDAEIIHGDLTTSNMIYVSDKHKSNVNDKKTAVDIKLKKSMGWVGRNVLSNDYFKIYFIDFGLGFFSQKAEDKAVDLHLLRQALEAKHFRHWQVLFECVLQGYSHSKQHKKVLEQFKKVEARGRYKDSY